MYITVKDEKRNQPSQIRISIIDELFGGNTDVVIPECIEESKLVRTKTYVSDTNETDAVTEGMMRVFFQLLKMRTELIPNPEEEYITFKIPKKTHGFREINAPKERLKKAMKDIADALTGYLKILNHDSAWAYTPGRDVVNAMKEHTANESKWYLKIDLHDFFGSCNPDFIVQQLKKVYPFAAFPTIATDIELYKLANFATLHNGLPQGTPLSPILTNIIMVEFDYKINKLIYNLTKDNRLMKQKYIYTRYADDIIISAKNKFEFNNLLDALKELFSNTPLTINEEKTRFGSSAGRNWNLGIMCNKDNNITIGYRRKQQLKSIVNNYAKDRRENHIWSLEDLYWLQGQFSWLHNVEPEYSKGFLEYLKKKHEIDIIKSIKADIKSYSN